MGRVIGVGIILLLQVMGCASNGPPSGPLPTAENLMDAFYSFDEARLTSAARGSSDTERVRYYQAWAQAANYQIHERRPCVMVGQDAVCRITVTDDFGETMGYMATDTFTIGFAGEGFAGEGFAGEKITKIVFEGDDPPIFAQLFAWIEQNRPEVIAGPCKDLFDGGTTPAQCARAVVDSARAFMHSRD